jgi:DNA-binding CsgD family transcriptional regulator
VVVSIGAVATGPIDRLAVWASRSAIRRPALRHTLALLAVVGAVAILEFPVTDFDHGTHLLVVLTLVMGIALVLGPGPATTGFATGGVLAGVATAVTVQGAFGTPHAYVQLLTYLLAGGAFIVLVSAVARSRLRPTGPPATAPAMAAGAGTLLEPLTARELEVLHLAASGIPVERIADQLFVSPNTVKTHLTHIYGKLGVHGRSDAIRAALHCGCLSPEDICPHLHENGHDESPVRVIPERRKV